MAQALRLPTLEEWKARFSSYNMGSAHGPNMVTNAHLKVASEDCLADLYHGLWAQAGGETPMQEDQLVAWLRLLFKAKDPHDWEKWRTIHIQSIDFKMVEDMLFWAEEELDRLLGQP